MKYVVMSIFDRAVGSYMRPMFVRSVGEGNRLFGDEVNRVAADNPMCKHPGDYELFKLCEFDDVEGKFLLGETGYGAPELVVRGSQVVTGP